MRGYTSKLITKKGNWIGYKIYLKNSKVSLLYEYGERTNAIFDEKALKLSDKDYKAKSSKKKNKITAKSEFVRVYNGKKQSFKVNAKALGGKLTYKSNKKQVSIDKNGKVTIKANYCGTACITITASDSSGKYEGISKKVTVLVKPQKISKLSVSSKNSKAIDIKWKKVNDVTGYQLQYSTDKGFKKSVKVQKIKKSSVVSKRITKLNGGKTYYIRMRTYVKFGGKEYYSDWSSIKKIKIS